MKRIMTDEEETITIEEPKKENKKQNILRVIAGIIVGIAIILIIIYKINNPEFPLSTLIIVILVICIVGAGIFFINIIYKKLSKKVSETIDEDGVPKASSIDEIEKELEKFMNKRMNHIKIPDGITPMYSQSIGKNTIYCFKVKFLYEDSEFGEEAYILVNSNYLHEKSPIMASTKSGTKVLTSLANGLSNLPMQEPDIEESIEENPLLGTKRSTKKTTYKEKKQKKPKKEEDIS